MPLDFTSHRGIGEALAARFAGRPDQPALTLYRGSAAPEHPTLSSAELARRAGLRAARLGRLAAGDRVLIALPTSTEFVELYLACLFAGVVAVPAPPPGGSAIAVERLAAIARDCTPGLAVTLSGDRELLAESFAAAGLGHIPVEAAGDAGDGPAPELGRPPARDALAIIQYSSGSTGTPRGVMLSHGDVLDNLASVHAYGLGPEDRFGSWLPLHHDFGLFIQLTAAMLYGAPAVLMAPSDFVRRPVEWFRMLSRYGSTATSAPNFAYDLCVRMIRDEELDGLDLSALRFVCNGSEPVHAPTMAAFGKRFQPIGLPTAALTAGYGLAETTVYVSANRMPVPLTVLVADRDRLEAAERPELRPAAGGAGKEIVGLGRPATLDLRVVDPATRRALPDGEVGEIWVRGDGVGRGYWGRPELSAQTFEARIDGEAAEGRGWLRTGDLGAVRDGELFVTGRIKELMIVRGRKLYPHDLEQHARAAHPALVGFNGAAFGVEADEERVVLVHEVGPKASAEELPAIVTAVQRRLTATFGVPVRNVLLVRRGGVSRTTSGKIQRAAMRERFLAGRIEATHAELEPAVRGLLPGSG